MSGRAASIRSVVVAGGGIAGWSTAAALSKRLPALSVTVVPIPPPPDALADRIGSTLPSIGEFHSDIGLTEADTVVRAGSSFRLGTWFEGWAEDRPPYVHAYGEYGKPFGTASFHHHWVRAAALGRAESFDSFSAAASIARAGRFTHPRNEPGSPLAGFGYGLAINPARYREMMRAYARHLGAAEREGEIGEVRLRGEDGFVEALRFTDGGELPADLFVDCTGPARRIRSALDERFEDWAAWLPCDRILFADAPPPAELPSLDKAVAAGAGWRWESASPLRTSHGLVYASSHLSDGKAERALRVATGVEANEAPVTLRSGRLAEPWFKNCVAIGDAAVAVEPLEWTNLHLAHNAIDRLVSMMPDRDCGAVELWDYNRQANAEADRVRDFLVLHYVASRRSEPFWRDAAAAKPPASLAHTLALFQERGRLPYYEEETFSRDSWLAVLLGQGLIPRRTDPLIDIVAPAAADQAMARMRSAIEALVPTLPSQTLYLQNLMRQAAR
ncbi:MAG TPA: tryptophan halogenase family protein [Allosphingosinicella sp.]|jgi:tryptophan halogenase|nr:tryptophan halogenase family protein [Allosphingosinicella sp.]